MEKLDQILLKLESIDQTLEETQGTVNKISVRQKRMENKVLGDKEFQTKGMIEEAADMKKELSIVKDWIAEKELKEKENKAMKKGAVIGWSAAGAGGLYGIVEFFKSLSH